MNEFKDKIALVTGASSGIGNALTRQLIAGGAAKVYVNARSHERLESLVAEYPGIAVPVVFDVSDEESIRSAVESIDLVDIAINNAGIVLTTGDTLKANKNDLMKEFEVNAIGPLLVTRSIDKSLSSNDAVIVNILSEAALITD